MRKGTCIAFAAAVLLAAAGAAEARRASPMRTAILSMERNVARLAKTSISDRSFTAIQGRRGAIWLRPQNKVIVVGSGFSQRGFQLGQNGKLSFVDRLRLARAIKKIQPGASGADVGRSVRAEIGRHMQNVRQLRGMNPAVNRLLDAASRVTGDKDVTIWQRGGASITYRPVANVLVGQRGMPTQGFFLSRTDKGLKVQSHHLQDLQRFLLSASR